MDRRTAVLTGMSVGAALMYALDPVMGRRRRALMRDQMVHLGRRGRRAAGVTRRDIVNRARGLQLETVSRFQHRGGARASEPLSRSMRRAVLRRVWPPSVRLAAGAAGALLAALGIRRGSSAGAVMAAAGSALMIRSVTNAPLRRLLGLGTGPHAVVVQKAIHINAPVDRVFDVWAAFENFPAIMAHVRDVRMLAADRSHWVVAGPGGVPVEWDAETTEVVPNQMLAWETAPGSIIQHSGVVRFDEENGGTRVTVRMAYNPATGMVGHAVAGLLGADPKARMDRDLVMMKTFIENRRQPRAAVRARAAGNGFGTA